MSDEAFARRFYADRAELSALGVPDPLAARRVHRRGAVHAEARAVLPAPAAPDRRRARSSRDGRLPARGPVRVRRAAAARPPEPRARPAEPERGLLPRRESETARQRVHRRGGPAPAEDRVGRLEAAHDRLPVLGDLVRRAVDAHDGSLQPVPARGPVVPRGTRPRPRGDPHVPALAHPRRRPLRDASRARLPHPRRVRCDAVARPRTVAARRERGDRDDPRAALRVLARRARREPPWHHRLPG